MLRSSGISRYCGSVLLFAVFFSTASVGQGTLAGNRDLMRRIAEGVADVIKKNFYDPSLKGVDLQKLLSETKQKIDASNNVGEMYAAIYFMVRKMDDSHTNFLPPWQTLMPKFGFKAKPYGEIVRVYDIKKDNPAAKAGLRLGDTILGIDGVKADRRLYLQTQFYYRFIQPAGVMVLDLQREGKPERMTVKADVHVRKAMDMAYDFSRVFDWIREDESAGSEEPFEYGIKDGIGYLRIPEFSSDLDLGKFGHFEGAEKFLWKVKDSSALIIDLRGNPGGSVTVLERFAGYFFSAETEIGDVVRRDKHEKLIAKPQHPSFSGIPIAVLVDSESASASEVLTRHLQRTGRAVIIGDKTAGDVSVARSFEQKIGADPAVFYGVQATIGHLIFPDGKDLEKVGVTPDTTCIPTADDVAAKRDPCLGVAVAALKAKLGKGTAERSN
jgi:carboxyl-terminal processing protease